MEVQGSFQVRARLQKMAATIMFEAARALYEEALIEMIEAKKRTPVDTGALRRSGTVDLPRVLAKSIEVHLHFGGTEPSSKYALYVHEDQEAFHRVGQADYLGSVIRESTPFMAARVARRIDLNKCI